MKIIVLSALICCCFYVNAQREYHTNDVKLDSQDSKIVIKPNGDTVLISMYRSNNVRQNSENEFDKVYKGTPYFQNGWYKSQVSLNGKDKSSGVIAFNLITNKVMFAAGLNKNAIGIKPVSFIINGHKFEKFTTEYTSAGVIYYERLINGYTELFKQYVCKYNPTNYGQKTGYEQSGEGYEGEFEKSITYYTIYHNKMTKINRKFKVFNELEEKAEQYTKENNLSLSSEQDLIKIVNYLNSLKK